MPKNFLLLDIKKAKKKYSDKDIIEFIKGCICNLTNENVKECVTQLNIILNKLIFTLEVENKEEIYSILDIVFQEGLSLDVVFDFLLKIKDDRSFQRKNIMLEYVVRKYSLVDYLELIVREYSLLIPLLWDQLLSNYDEDKVREFLLLLKREGICKDGYCLEYLTKFPYQKNNLYENYLITIRRNIRNYLKNYFLLKKKRLSRKLNCRKIIIINYCANLKKFRVLIPKLIMRKN